MLKRRRFGEILNEVINGIYTEQLQVKIFLCVDSINTIKILYCLQSVFTMKTA